MGSANLWFPSGDNNFTLPDVSLAHPVVKNLVPLRGVKRYHGEPDDTTLYTVVPDNILTCYRFEPVVRSIGGARRPEPRTVQERLMGEIGTRLERNPNPTTLFYRDEHAKSGTNSQFAVDVHEPKRLDHRIELSGHTAVMHHATILFGKVPVNPGISSIMEERAVVLDLDNSTIDPRGLPPNMLSVVLRELYGFREIRWDEAEQTGIKVTF